jgi:hypothetical protein
VVARKIFSLILTAHFIEQTIISITTGMQLNFFFDDGGTSLVLWLRLISVLYVRIGTGISIGVGGLGVESRNGNGDDGRNSAIWLIELSKAIDLLERFLSLFVRRPFSIVGEAHHESRSTLVQLQLFPHFLLHDGNGDDVGYGLDLADHRSLWRVCDSVVRHLLVVRLELVARQIVCDRISIRVRNLFWLLVG